MVASVASALQLRQPNRIAFTLRWRQKKGAGVYRSDDSGESWSLVNSDRRIGGRWVPAQWESRSHQTILT